MGDGRSAAGQRAEAAEGKVSEMEVEVREFSVLAQNFSSL